MSTENTNDDTATVGCAPAAGSGFAVPPYRLHKNNVLDANGHRVLVCSEDTECPHRFAEDVVDAIKWFMCPRCNRLASRMVEASAEQCGLSQNVKTVATCATGDTTEGNDA